MKRKVGGLRGARVIPGSMQGGNARVSRPEIGDRTNEVFAKPVEEVAPVYANHMQITMTNSEMILDFYRLIPTGSDEHPVEATHVQRVIVPHVMGKGLVTAVANVISEYERDNNIKIPNFRPYRDDEKIRIWE